MGLVVHALNAMPDQVHLVASIPPSLSVATVVGQLKGAASAAHNRDRGTQEPAFYWQEECGVFSLDRKRLAAHVTYVNGQKARHAKNRVIVALERERG